MSDTGYPETGRYLDRNHLAYLLTEKGIEFRSFAREEDLAALCKEVGLLDADGNVIADPQIKQPTPPAPPPADDQQGGNTLSLEYTAALKDAMDKYFATTGEQFNSEALIRLLTAATEKEDNVEKQVQEVSDARAAGYAQAKIDLEKEVEEKANGIAAYVGWLEDVATPAVREFGKSQNIPNAGKKAPRTIYMDLQNLAAAPAGTGEGSVAATDGEGPTEDQVAGAADGNTPPPPPNNGEGGDKASQ